MSNILFFIFIGITYGDGRGLARGWRGESTPMFLDRDMYRFTHFLYTLILYVQIIAKIIHVFFKSTEYHDVMADKMILANNN